MTKHSTLLYWINDFNKNQQETYNPVVFADQYDSDFLNAFFQNLEFDPGVELVNKILMKSI